MRSSNNGGWLTTKKRGRDDAEIEKAKQAAKERRKLQNGRGGRSNAATTAAAAKSIGKGDQSVKKKKAAATKKKTMKDDDYEEDDFLVDDDSDDEEEEEEEDEFESEDDEEEEEISEAADSSDDGDDDEVLIVAAAALKNRAAASTASSSSCGRRGAAAAASSSLQKHVTYSSNDDDDDDDDSNVDDEDDDVFKDEAPPPRKGVAASARSKKTIKNANDDSSSSEGESFLPDYPHRTSRAAPHITMKTQRPTAAAKRESNSKKNKNQRNQQSTGSVLEDATTTATTTQSMKQAARTKKKQTQRSRAAAAADDESHVDIFQKKKKKTTTPTFSIESSSDDDNDDFDLLSRKKTKPAAAAASLDLTELDDDNDNDNNFSVPAPSNEQRVRKLKKLGQKKPVVATAAAPAAAKETKSHCFAKKTSPGDREHGSISYKSHEEGETPVGISRNKAGGNNRRVVAHHHDEDDDDEAEFHIASAAACLDDSDIMDEDEQTALAVALSESAAEATAANTKTKNKQIVNVDLVDSEDEENNDDDGDEAQDAFVNEDDPDAKTADMVLSTANQLSAQILQTMTQWIVGNCKNDKDDNGNDNNNNTSNGNGSAGAPKLPPVGMIVDGALAMSNMASNSGGDGPQDNSNERPDWISRETMQDICPDVTLANYQLIGVNWMALLHGMKVQVGSSPDEAIDVSKKKKKKKYINVNGILADEMGLGKTVQTICFLAWLKHTRQVKGNRHTLFAAAADDDDEVLMDSDDDDILTQRQVSGASNSNEPPPPPLSLIVAPSSVLSNWEREFEKFAPHMKVVKYHGSIAEREEIQEDLRRRLLMKGYRRQAASFVKRKKDSDLDTSDDDEDEGGVGDNVVQEQDGPMSLDVILAPVTYFQQEKSNDRVFLRKLSYEYLVVDEAHLLKNARGLRYKNLDRFRTTHRLLLTGTPVQNSPAELICLLSFATRLFSRSAGAQGFDDGNENDGGESMLKHFVEAHRVNSGTKNGSGDDDDGYAAAYKKLKQLFSPFVLRRRKVDVLSQIMPPKERTVEFVTLNDASRAVYDSILCNHINNKKKRGAGSNSGTDHVFTQLRKAAHHPLLLRTRYISAPEKEHLNRCFHTYGAFRGAAATLPKVAEQLEKFNDFDIHLTALDLIEENPCRKSELDRYVLDAEDLFSSPKFVRLRALLPQLVADGHRVLIFSVWTSCLDLLTCLMDSMNLDYIRMQGDTAVQERQGLIDKFNNDPSIPVFLLSTTACGLGINLTSADTCIMHDISFNPFNDLQAEDRCHRIGQKRPVTVIKLVTQDTVDNDIFEMQERKAKMNAAIMENNESSSTTSSSEWSKQAQQNVLRTAVDRYLKSPPTASSKRMDNNNNSSSSSSSSSKKDNTATIDEKKATVVMDGLCKENTDNVVGLSDSTEI